MITTVAITSFVLAVIPAAMLLVNLLFYRRAPQASGGSLPAVSLLIPARNEETTIARALETARRSRDIELEIVVMDDDSRDRTASIVRSISREDPRVRLVQAPPLPPGWCGKQHACAALAEEATHDVLVFVDADVTLSCDALARMVGVMERRSLDLLSGIPRQVTGTLGERLLLPLIHFVLLGFLPFPGVRYSRKPAYAAGCGQLMAVRRHAYEAIGGHGSIRESRHDGIRLPREFRRGGWSTDLVDATDLASCRMYHGAAEVWSGLAKNATEGMASPAGILPWTLILFGGQVLPFLLTAYGAVNDDATFLIWGGIAAALGLASRLVLAWRFRQSWVGAFLHPIGVSTLLAIQWFALTKQLIGQPVAWKGRTA